MKRLLFILFALPAVAMAQTDTIAHGLYKWVEPAPAKDSASVVLFEGSTHDFSWMQLKSASLHSPSVISQSVSSNEELLMIIKEGGLKLWLRDSIYLLGGGSVFLLMPGEKYQVQAGTTAPCKFYALRYRSKLPANVARADSIAGSFAINWDLLPEKLNARGFRRDYFDRATVMTRRFEMHVTTLKDGFSSHDPHRHPHEEIILNIDNKTEMLIGDKTYQGEPGDLYFLTSNIFHGVKNSGKGLCSYFAFRFE